MTWFDLVTKGKGRAAKGIATRAKKAIDDLMSDGVKRSAKEILNDMWDVIGHKRDIPSVREIKRYVGTSHKYDSGFFDMYTGKRLAVRSKNKIIKYWIRGV